MSFLQGAIAMCFALAGLFFFRFWRDTLDRLFLLFAASFWLQALESHRVRRRQKA
jgi:hypothetical protein